VSDALTVTCERKTTVFCPRAKTGIDAKHFQDALQAKSQSESQTTEALGRKNGWGP